uniref:Uncharacterized protein n=1 Tax=Micromonas pusilla TaxID=38833 RepID=A0A7S0NK93_MICPS|mmetsp:Transcript_731/g.3034  ORF Transcript_731/g.3034 Transcript_731/m.3034 type:complete len:117 (-) Transcript_731:120-470(-)
MGLDNSVHDRNIPSFNAEDHHISKFDRVFFMKKEQDVATLERWLHRPAEDDDDRRATPSEQNQTLPYHQSRRDYKPKANELKDKVTTLQRSKPFQDFSRGRRHRDRLSPCQSVGDG